TKPFSPRELAARVASVLRRSNGVPDAAPAMVLGTVRVEPAQRRGFPRPGRVFSREQLLSEVWGYSSSAGPRTVDVHIAQLRAKLGAASPVRTVRGVGYAVESSAASGGASHS